MAAAPVLALSSRGCRAGAERSMRRMTRAGLETIEACHLAREGGADVAECNVLPIIAGNAWIRQTTLTGAFVSAKCAPDDRVRRNYPPCEGSCDNIANALVAGTREKLQTEAAEIADESRLTGRAARCRRVLLKAHRRLATSVLSRSQRCQARRDLNGGDTTYGPIDDDCFGAARQERETGKIARACQTLAGADVGSCEPLPDCVVEAAQQLGRDMASLTYGEPAACGDGVPDPLEECDDGNTVPTDACTDQCKTGRCGDGITWAEVEQCDDGNDIRTDYCDACTLPVCGDGITAGDEECDDENTTPGDGCTDCRIDAVLCGAGGMTARVTYDDPEATGAAAGRMLIAYPDAVSLPGSGPAGTVRQRVVAAADVSNPIFLPSDNDTDADDVDDTLVLVWGTTAPWPAGPFATITFDCAAGSPVRAPDFVCSFDDASDAFSNAVDPSALFCAVTALEPLP